MYYLHSFMEVNKAKIIADLSVSDDEVSRVKNNTFFFFDVFVGIPVIGF